MDAEITDKMSAKGWKKTNNRQSKGTYSVRMIKAFSFAHSIEVIFAKALLRGVRSSWLCMIGNLTKPKDSRALSLVKSKLVHKLNKFNKRLTVKKAFFRWFIHSNISIPRTAIEKIAINARINHLIATYRFIKIARIGLGRDKKHKHLYHGLDLTDQVMNKLYDKYNTRLTVLEQAFNRIKDNYIRCSRLLRLESVIAKIIERKRWRSAFFENVKSLIKLKSKLCNRMIESSRAKQVIGMECLKSTVHDYMRNLAQQSKTKTDFQLIQKIFDSKLKQQLSECIRRMRLQREKTIEANEILQRLFQSYLRSCFKTLATKRSASFDTRFGFVVGAHQETALDIRTGCYLQRSKS
jgi:hypothetical protein